ncbi:hypothetical protein HYC85_006251 [Camellia sinensis]|uniref:Protein Iojap-related, mitochondrial n=1 Tax=Camellia sinensis TaxID=4442 RepID=A0A7J7HLG3_CAMSI|nr:hypothetical protein HYC85_006251 [Camellia sinensis]
MWAALRSRALLLSSSSYSIYAVTHQWKSGFNNFNRTLCSSLVAESDTKKGLLNLEEVQKVLTDVKADNVKVVPVRNHCDWTDFMVFVTGRSAWHVRNIAQALIYKASSLSKSKGVLRGCYSPAWKEKRKGSGLLLILALISVSKRIDDLTALLHMPIMLCILCWDPISVVKSAPRLLDFDFDISGQ